MTGSKSVEESLPSGSVVRPYKRRSMNEKMLDELHTPVMEAS